MSRNVKWLAAGIVLVVVGCDQDSAGPGVVDDPQTIAPIRSYAADVGHMHNECQRHVYAALMKEKEEAGRLTRASLESVAVKACREWVHSIGGDPKACNVISDRLDNHRRGLSAPSPAQVAVLPRIEASSEYWALLDDLEASLDRVSTAQAYAQATSSLMAKAETRLSNTRELQAFAAVVAGADSSEGYWGEKMQLWLNGVAPSCEDPEYEEHPACGPIPAGPQRSWVDWICGERCRRVMGADISGAVFAATYSWIAGPGAEIPVVATAGATSAAAAVLELWDMIVN